MCSGRAVHREADTRLDRCMYMYSISTEECYTVRHMYKYNISIEKAYRVYVSASKSDRV